MTGPCGCADPSVFGCGCHLAQLAPPPLAAVPDPAPYGAPARAAQITATVDTAERRIAPAETRLWAYWRIGLAVVPGPVPLTIVAGL